jgi:superfamily II DNA or RNA helicase
MTTIKKRPEHVLEVLDSVWVRCSPTTAKIIEENIFYIDSYWIQGPFRKEKQEYQVSLVEKVKGEYLFYAGLLSRVLEIFKKRKEKIILEDHRKEVFFDDPHIEGGEFRKFQAEALERALERGNGIIHHATGTGKSFVILGLVSAFNQENILFLVHTKDLMYQLASLMEKYGIEHKIFHNGAKKDKKGVGRVTVTTVQTYKKVCTEYADYWDVVIIDEGHHVNAIYAQSKRAKKYAQYAHILLNTDAPVRYALTATLPSTDKQKLCLEALIGPVIHTYNMQQASKEGVLATCQVNFIPTTKLPLEMVENNLDIRTSLGEYHEDGRPKKYSKYQVVYFNAISQNTQRNIAIVRTVLEHLNKGETVLVCASQTWHIENLEDLSHEFGIPPMVVDGRTPDKERQEIKERFEEGLYPYVIASSVWNEGVSIDTIDVVINAGGGLDEKRVLQLVGRGLRTCKTKKHVQIYDVDDVSHKYLRDHTKERKKTYAEMGWFSN